MIVIDTTVLLFILQPNAPAPIDPNTGKPVEKAKERIEHLIDNLAASKERILVPTPVLAELMIRAEDATGEYLQRLSSYKVFVPADFDQRAAIEHAQLSAAHFKKTGVKKVNPGQSLAKMKFDWQIVAIAKVHGASRIYTDDKDDLTKAASIAKIPIVHTWELPLPPTHPQGDLNLGNPDGEEEAQ